jgi:hypothetical protein
MSLSAMLGKRVDLSQVRALFASGDQEGALRALKAQGLDPSKMNMFQQEALKNATGGLDLNSLQSLYFHKLSHCIFFSDKQKILKFHLCAPKKHQAFACYRLPESLHHA